MLRIFGPVVLVLMAQAGRPQAVPSLTRAELRGAIEAARLAETKALDALAAGVVGTAGTRIKGMGAIPTSPDGSSRFLPMPEVVPKAGPVQPEALKAICDHAAEALFEIARKALALDPPYLALADHALRGVVERNPDHAEARRLLGYVPHDGGWATPFAAKKLGEGFVPHPVFGWVESAWVPHLDRGELPAPFVAGRPTRWLPAAEADALRRDFARSWQINTEHFAIRTNVPLAEVIAFGRHLETLYDVFFSMMADLIGPTHPLALRARDPKLAPALPRKTHTVFYFGGQDEFVSYLLPAQGEGIRDSLGTYLPLRDARRFGFKAGVSFFFRDPGGQLDATDTLYHEASHQLLFESAGPDRYDEKASNFWVFEGLGTYFETLRPQPDGSVRVGGLVGKRIEQARLRLVENGEFIPIGRLATFNKYLFNGGNGNDIYLNYAEAMALAVYLMQAHDGRHREAFLDYARDVYKGRLRAGQGRSLDDRLGGKLGEVDRDFLFYLKGASLPKPPAR